MPFREVSTVESRSEFVRLASRDEANVRELCRRYGISSATGYKWIRRYEEAGEAGLKDRSRRPKNSPNRSNREFESHVLRIRREQPAWGAVTIRQVLQDEGIAVKAASTVHAILVRHGQIDPKESEKHRPWKRFEHAAPNDLWQMDFKGHFAVQDGKRCHPLTILDDHSRFVVCLKACENERTEGVRKHLVDAFRQYGLPLRMTMDNGAPWGSDTLHRDTPLTVWLRRLGVRVSHSRPYHPQTQGKDERFHRTLKAELLRNKTFDMFSVIQSVFDDYRDVYNQRRPHHAIGLVTPIQRYKISPRNFPEYLPPIEYGECEQVRTVDEKGRIRFQGRRLSVGKGYYGHPVALRPTENDGVWNVFFCCDQIAQWNFRNTTG
jgi:transposase InsO family protein